MVDEDISPIIVPGSSLLTRNSKYCAVTLFTLDHIVPICYSCVFEHKILLLSVNSCPSEQTSLSLSQLLFSIAEELFNHKFRKHTHLFNGMFQFIVVNLYDNRD